MIGPLPPGAMGDDPWENEFGGNTTNNNAMQAWRERERRQRTVRLLMMFLLMLLLMDGEEQNSRRRHHPHGDANNLRGKTQIIRPPVLEEELFSSRIHQDGLVQNAVQGHGRKVDLLGLNEGQNVEREVLKWAHEQETKQNKGGTTTDEKDPHDRKKVYHYPWNATGFYRGEWTRQESTAASPWMVQEQDNVKVQYKTAKEMESSMQTVLKQRKEQVGLFLLPPHVKLSTGLSNLNVTKLESDQQAALEEKRKVRQRNQRPAVSLWNLFFAPTQDEVLVPEEDEEDLEKLTLTKMSGRVAFQIYSRSVPAMKELSLLEGFVKLYDSETIGYSTRQDVLLRVRGVLLHSIGRISMVANEAPGRSAFVIAKENGRERRQLRLKESLSKLTNSPDVEQLLVEESIRNDVLELYSFDSLTAATEEFTMNEDLFDEKEKRDILTRLLHGWNKKEHTESESARTPQRNLGKVEDTPVILKEVEIDLGSEEAKTQVETKFKEEKADKQKYVESSKPNHAEGTRRAEYDSTAETAVSRSKLVFPYPYVQDDKRESLQKAKTPTSRRIPKPEKPLEANAGSCEFELNFDVQAIQWTVGEWRTLVGRRVHETNLADPRSLKRNDKEFEEQDLGIKAGSVAARMHGLPESTTRKLLRDQALVTEIVGTVRSPNCDFTANINATAIRTNWEQTTGKAINYSFYMMLTCLTQIVVLLRQLLHTQAQSAATRVSLLCIGWQTVLDALLCLGHISLSLSMQPLFTAFASVAFFKLLIFCVIEMKYMAIIMQARNNSNGGQNTAELLRRQVTMLHLRFYAALMAVLMAFFYAGEQYRTLYVLFLYSFWVPQIILNIVTEAKRPLHHYYIYGMSVSRLVAPLYIFAVPHNFLKEVYPDAPSYPFMCQLLVLWIGVQTAILIAQGRYGARFMIPARFLPPKFDYSRPIPESLLPPGVTPASPESSFMEGMTSEVEVQTIRGSDSGTTSDRHSTTTRNRIKGNRARSGSSNNMTTTETPMNTNSTTGISDGPTLDCVICYNAIDVHNRRGYMLAPCDHVFHRECLMQWMDVKMECPICRTELPTL